MTLVFKMVQRYGETASLRGKSGSNEWKRVSNIVFILFWRLASDLLEAFAEVFRVAEAAGVGDVVGAYATFLQ